MLAFLALPVPAPARPPLEGAARGSEDLREQVVRGFDELDHVTQAIESVQADIAWVRERISALSREIESQQQILNRRAAEAYMVGSAGGIDSVLRASSFTDVQDALEFLEAVSQRDHDVLLVLEQRKAEMELQRLRLEALEEELRASRERLEVTVSTLVEMLRRQQAVLARRTKESPPEGSVGDITSPPPPRSSPPGPALAREQVKELIRDQFASLGPRTVEVALCIAEAESGLDPSALNQATGAAGLFQFISSTWASLSELAGWGAASVFEARANAAVAAWTVAHYGWHPWRSVASDCRA